MRQSGSLDSRQIAAMHCLFFMTGVGAMLLGPLLPALIAVWHLRDQQAGVLLGAQFAGSFAGATTLRTQLRSDLAVACCALALGFAGLALASRLATGFPLGVAALLLGGFGLGRAITAINLIAGFRFRRHRASALSMLNLTWSLGAVAAPLTVAAVAATLKTPGIAEAYGIGVLSLCAVAFPFVPAHEAQSDEAKQDFSPAHVSADVTKGLLFFALLFFLYGGLEAGVSGWLSTFAIRATGGTLRVGAEVAGFLWIGLTAGRALASLLLLRLRERTLLAVGMVITAVGCALMAYVQRERTLIVLAVTMGLGLAPAFPALCSLLLASRRHPAHAGRVMAVSSLGGALFGWAIGAISERAGSWRTALLIPLALSLLLFLLPRFLSLGSAPDEWEGEALGKSSS